LVRHSLELFSRGFGSIGDAGKALLALDRRSAGWAQLIVQGPHRAAQRRVGGFTLTALPGAVAKVSAQPEHHQGDSPYHQALVTGSPLNGFFGLFGELVFFQLAAGVALHVKTFLRWDKYL